MPKVTTPLADRFWSKVERRGSDECWHWTAAVVKTGYGWFNRGPKQGPTTAHRIAWMLTHGDIPKGLYVDHVCHNADLMCDGGSSCPHRRCCNPAHLELVTHAENVTRGRAGARYAARTHCPHGHEYTPENTLIGKSGSRFCRACKRASWDRWAENHTEAP